MLMLQIQIKHVNASAKTHNKDVDIKHIIKHALSCTLEKDGEDLSSCDCSRFGMVHEVLNMERLRLY